jgi:hypothetical protein
VRQALVGLVPAAAVMQHEGLPQLLLLLLLLLHG